MLKPPNETQLKLACLKTILHAVLENGRHECSDRGVFEVTSARSRDEQKENIDMCRR